MNSQCKNSLSLMLLCNKHICHSFIITSEPKEILSRNFSIIPYCQILKDKIKDYNLRMTIFFLNICFNNLLYIKMEYVSTLKKEDIFIKLKLICCVLIST